MKKSIYILSASILLIVLSSWGREGHSVIGLIAERHLTSKAKTAINQLLAGNSISAVASWADEVRSQPEYRSTAPWHFVNVPMGLNQGEFADYVEHSDKPNLYSALLKNEQDIKSTATTQEQKAIALRFIIHLVGDAHQPMHVSRSEDKGGNTIQVQFNDQGTNLHALWDSKLIDKQGIIGEQLADKLDHSQPAQIKKWQTTAPVDWLYESYTISSQLYEEAEVNHVWGDDYFNKHIGIVNLRLEEAGIRLAGVLNSLFVNGLAPSKPLMPITISTPLSANLTPHHIALEDAAKHIGEYVTVSGKVFGYKELDKLVLVDIGAPYPNQLLTVVLLGDARSVLALINNQTIEITGKIIDYKGKPEIEIKDKSNIHVKQP